MWPATSAPVTVCRPTYLSNWVIQSEKFFATSVLIKKSMTTRRRVLPGYCYKQKALWFLLIVTFIFPLNKNGIVDIFFCFQMWFCKVHCNLSQQIWNSSAVSYNSLVSWVGTFLPLVLFLSVPTQPCHTLHRGSCMCTYRYLWLLD